MPFIWRGILERLVGHEEFYMSTLSDSFGTLFNGKGLLELHG